MAGKRRIIDDSDSSDSEVMIVDNVDNNNNVGKDKANSTTTRTTAPQQQQQAIHPQLQQKIYTEAGVQPSNYWLEKCLSHLRNVGNDSILGSSNLEEESLWTQILHADLRDVVRDPYGNSTTNQVGDGEESAAVQLRNAINQSKTNASNNSANVQQYNSYNSSPDSMQQHVSSKVTLPSSFHLLVQMEEVCDVTMNSEQQLAAMGGGSSSGAPQNNNNGRQPYNNQGQRNQKYRMLKMVFSDGYYPNGKPYPPTSSNSQQQNQILLSMETSPIKNLSVSSPPGLKLLLHGPIDVRFGILQLNNGNCTVIGGYIERWKEIWIQARERAQKSRGLGVDPTIKALIGTEGIIDGEEEEVDEGEGESGDVTAAPPPPPPQQRNHQPSHNLEDDGLGPFQPWNNNIHGNMYQQPQQGRNNTTHPNQNAVASQQQSNMNMSNNPATLQNRNHQGQSSSTINAASSRNNNTGNLRQQTLDSYPKKPRPETTRLLPNNSNNGASRPAVQQQIGGGNPYQRANNNNSNNNGGRNAQSNNSNNNNLAPVFQQRPQQQPQRPQQQPQRQQQQRPPPPVAAAVRNNSNVIPIDDDSPPKANPYASLRPPAATNNTSQQQVSSSSSTSFNSNPSFSELRSLLQSLRSNRALYDQYYGKVITVPCKISDSSEQEDKHFNIVKSNSYGSPQKTKKKNKKDKKYEFLLVGKVSRS